MSRLKLIFVMLLWGSIGVFSRYINIDSVTLAFFRAFIGAITISVFYLNNKKKDDVTTFKLKEAAPFIISGAILGLAWICMFEAFNRIDIPIAVLVYNMCPVYVLLLAPLVLKEKLPIIQFICVLVAFLGLGIIVSTAFNKSNFNVAGLIFGILSGVLYAILVVINRMAKTNYNSTTITLIQMISASIVLLPFVLLKGEVDTLLNINLRSIIFIIILGVVHTGIGYYLYFSTYKNVTATTIASFSYLEPVFSIILSSIILGEVLMINQIVGGVLILGSTFVGELIKVKSKNTGIVEEITESA